MYYIEGHGQRCLKSTKSVCIFRWNGGWSKNADRHFAIGKHLTLIYVGHLGQIRRFRTYMPQLTRPPPQKK